jgi:hypothetical protein
MTGMIEGFRSAFLARPFDIPVLTISLGVACLLFLIGVASDASPTLFDRPCTEGLVINAVPSHLSSNAVSYTLRVLSRRST